MKSIFGIKKSKLKEERGSASALALFTVLTFSLILIGVYMTIMTKQKSQLKSDMRIQEIYAEDVKNVDMIYEMQKAIRDESYNVSKDVNSPALLTGMIPIRFTMPTNTQMGILGTVDLDQDSDWYEYGKTDDTRRWANAQTEDGSMWVWIPRYAYKITYYTDANKTTVSNTKTTYGSIDIKFLIGKTDYYYDEQGNIQVAKRCESEDEIVDTTSDYVVHPAFTDESNINFRNGGWDEELTGIWVAKFEAGYASGNNDATVKASNVNYTEPRSWVITTEAETANDSRQVARNWLDGVYSKEDSEGTMTYEDKKYSWLDSEVSIKYPVFQPLTYSMNYINHNDSYKIAKGLTNPGNIYGLDNEDANSHLMKNSEWGAVAYLSQSQYGLNGKNIYINNVSLNNSTTSVYAVTGIAASTEDSETKVTTIKDINDGTATNVCTWEEANGTKSSTTGTIYGIYDLSGGVWERTASLINNGNSNLANFGSSLLNNGVSTKYVTVYPSNDSGVTVLNTASERNYQANTKIYGDGIREVSIAGINSNSWYKDYSVFPGYYSTFFMLGGRWSDTSDAGLFAYSRNDGTSAYHAGFRAVLVPINEKSPIEPVIIEGPRLGGSYDNPYIPSGFTHTEGNGTWNSGYTIRETSTGNEFVWVPCVTDQSKVKSGDTVVTFGKTLPSTTDKTDPYYMYNKNKYEILGDENPASDIRKSVEEYSGFYIAKYEAGVPLNESGVEIGPTAAKVTQKARSVAGAKVWSSITRTNAIIAAGNMISTSDGVKSGLISGEAWDTTLQWMVKSSDNAANEPNLGYDIDSTGNGWYSDVATDSNGNKAKTTTGQYPINSIYDMAGNVWEWTTENCTLNDGTGTFSNRGGNYSNLGSAYPAALRSKSIDQGYGNMGFRVVLYK